MDFLIAATALVHGLTLVTHNIQDFASIADLRVVREGASSDTGTPGRRTMEWSATLTHRSL
jgi:hypothetical protein